MDINDILAVWTQKNFITGLQKGNTKLKGGSHREKSRKAHGWQDIEKFHLNESLRK